MSFARQQARGAVLMGEVAQYEDKYRFCYIRGPEGIIVALAEQLRKLNAGQRVGLWVSIGHHVLRSANIAGAFLDVRDP
jgi:hypothetical protein